MKDATEIVSALEDARRTLAAQDEADTGDEFKVYDVSRLVAAPIVSVEVLAYNHAWSLRRCIESIVRQKTRFEFEIIIGNDCSADETQEVAEQLQSEHPELITIVSTRRNVGLNRNARNVRRLMRGKYAAFCEADDWWAVDDKLQRQVDRMEANPSISLLHGLSVSYDEVTKNFKENKYRFPNRKPTFDWVFDETYRVETAGVMCRTADLMRMYQECPEAVGAKFLMLDTQLFTWLARQGEIECEQRAVSVRSHSGQSLSRNNDIVKAMKYHDNAFAMKMMLCDLFCVGRTERMRSINFYLRPAVEMMARYMPYGEAVTAARLLYPRYTRRLMFMRLFPRPRTPFLSKLYCHYLFPCVKFRNAFA